MNVTYVYSTFSIKTFACFGLRNGVAKENFVPCASHTIDNARDDQKTHFNEFSPLQSYGPSNLNGRYLGP